LHRQPPGICAAVEQNALEVSNGGGYADDVVDVTKFQSFAVTLIFGGKLPSQSGSSPGA
jgi:hypothetical protein